MSQFTLVQSLVSPVPGSVVDGVNIGDGFGAAVSLYGNSLAISAQNATIDSVSNAGALVFYQGQYNCYNPSQPIFSELLQGDVPGAYNTLKIKGTWAMCSVGSSVSGGPGPSAHPGGAVLIFQQSTIGKWGLSQTLLPNDPPTYVYEDVEYGIEFGGQFPDFNGEWAFIGSPQNMVDGVPLAGNVYVYNLQNGIWVLTQKITSPAGATFNQAFGGACYINGNYAFISAEGNYTQFGNYPPDNGYAYFYQLNSKTNQWEFVELIRGNSPPPPSPDGLGDLFGFRIQFNNDWAIIGAPLDSTNSSEIVAAGATYFYKAINHKGSTNWQLVAKVYPQNLYIQGAYGTNLFLQGNTVFITNNGSSADGSLKHAGLLEVYQLQGDSKGGGYIFKYPPKDGSWNYVTSILNPNPHQLDFFGANMSATDHQLVVGENPNFAYYLPYIDVPTPSSFNNGTVYIYKY